MKNKNPDKQEVLTELPAFSFVKLTKFCFKTFIQMTLFLIMEVLIFPVYASKKKGVIFLFVWSARAWN